MHRQQWWISVRNQPHGPHDREWILAGLESGQVTADQLACPVGGGEWKPVQAWPEFLNYEGAPPPPRQALPESNAQSATPESLFTNPQLPPLGNAICVYVILVSPVLWVIYNLSCCVSPDFFISSAPSHTPEFKIDIASSLIEAVWGLIVTVALFIGGLKLRTVRRSGATILKAALWTTYAFYVLYLIILMALYIVFASDTPAAEPTTAETLIIFFLFILVLVEFVFQIVALVWIHRIAPTRPLTAD